jgi:hypothetical protein
VHKYDQDGVEMWGRQFGTANGASATGVTVDGTGVYVVGQEGSADYVNDVGLDGVAETLPGTTALIAKFANTAELSSGPRIFPDCVVNG